MSDFLAGKAVRKVVKGIVVNRDTDVPPQTANEDIFTIVGGRVLLVQILGEVTTVIGAGASNLRIRHNPTIGAVGNICADVAIANDAEGVIYGITGTVATAMQKSTDALVAQADELILQTGTINIIASGSTGTGSIKWSVLYVPIDDGAYVEVA